MRCVPVYFVYVMLMDLNIMYICFYAWLCGCVGWFILATLYYWMCRDQLHLLLLLFLKVYISGKLKLIEKKKRHIPSF
ncbi:hypothetical protein BDA99DRAFT_502697 [Phascolomyces articulosus]|uniref:Uncharacterized protein n=1 Tax=Phascolomyces articulosus TaxID=60185 RepID=A0AAD5PH46_9FUNG|nr:hypothetical protein BDA99DRAFT_502697 [Phascolomyces articulosus]